MACVLDAWELHELDCVHGHELCGQWPRRRGERRRRAAATKEMAAQHILELSEGSEGELELTARHTKALE